MLNLLANNSALRRFLQFAALSPIVPNFVLMAEHDLDSAPSLAKRTWVIDQTTTAVQALIARGFLPDEVLEGLEKTTGELADTFVRVNNETGIFKHRTKAKKELAAAEKGKETK